MHEGIHIALKAEVLGHFFGVPITNTMLMSWIVLLVLIGLGYYVGRNLTKIPGKLQTFFETLFSFLIDYIAEVLESRTLALRFLPLIATLFLFILCGNWFGLIPGINSVTVDPSVHTAAATQVSPDPLFVRAPTAPEAEAVSHRVSLLYPVSVDLNVTLALSIIAFLVIELISELARLISFSFRLFGNMFAGKTLILVTFFFVPYLVPVPLMLYEVLVGFIQASIFALLTLFFIKLAVSEAH